MKHGIAKSLVPETIRTIVNETIVDAYAHLGSLDHSVIRKDDLVRDIQYLDTRFRSEGLAFYTVTLPRLGEWFDRWLQGLPAERVEGFEPYDGLCPVFLRPFWLYLKSLRARFADRCALSSAVLRSDIDGTGDLLSPEQAELVRLIRTLLLGMKKLEVPSSRQQVADKLSAFLEIEKELDYFDVVPSPALWRAQALIEDLFSRYQPDCRKPRHGPGAVSGGERGLGKWKFSTLYATVHAEWPYYEYLFGVRSAVFDSATRQYRSRAYQLAESAKAYSSLRRTPEPTARLLFVPKDSKGPRVISCEPVELMYLQQGVADHLVRFLELHPFTRGHINFDDQETNGRLALIASSNREWATIDLSDASDRVSVQLINFLYPYRVSKKWCALRSTATKLPDGRVVRLRKFAPMGSALCFPVESLTFWALAVGCIWECSRSLSLALDSVYVFGDDIIVKDEYYAAVANVLESVALKVNRQKSFAGNSPFRESCGIDALAGHIVTPLRVKKFPPQRPSDGTAIVAYTMYAENSVYLAPQRSALLISIVEKLVGRIPRTPVSQSYLSMVHPEQAWSHSDYQGLRWDPSLCYWTSRLYSLQSRGHREEWQALFRLQNNLIMGCSVSDPSWVVDRSSTQIRKKRLGITYLPMAI